MQSGPPPRPPYGPPAPYAPAPYGGGYYPPPARPTNVLAIIALVCAFVVAPAGVVCGIIARRQIRQTGEEGDGLALAAIVISAVQIVFIIFVFGIVIVFNLALFGILSQVPDPAPSGFPSPLPTS